MAIELLVDVTDEDIAHGVKGDCSECPIALATARAADEAKVSLEGRWRGRVISVDGAEIVVGKLRGKSCESVQQFVSQFDEEWTVNPFQFTVSLKSEDES